jgi:replicative DNA helicase
MIKSKWKPQLDALHESLSYLKGRKEGTITSIKTPWPSFNNATLDGIEWHSTTVIGARPATGKTIIKTLLVNGAFAYNPGMKFRVLEFQLEMLGRNSIIREYSTHIGKSYKQLCSADQEVGLLTDEELENCRLYASSIKNRPLDIVEEPCTVEEFKEIIHEYMLLHSTLVKTGEVTKRMYTNTIITLDHSLLLKKGKGEKDKNDMLNSLGEALTFLKKKYPIAFIIISQLNRNIDSPERNEDGKYGNFILESDIFGADALLQHADTLIGLNRPGKQKIKFYGVERYIINRDPNILVMHFLKSRNGDTGLAFFKTEYEKMRLHPIPAPPTQERKLNV